MKGLIESVAFILAPQNTPIVVNTIMKRLKSATHRWPSRVPGPGSDLRSKAVRLFGRPAQYTAADQNPKSTHRQRETGGTNRQPAAEETRDSGFVQKTYAAYGVVDINRQGE
jgi:hypothetical protein